MDKIEGYVSSVAHLIRKANNKTGLMAAVRINV